jgi:hypothetical protein
MAEDVGIRVGEIAPDFELPATGGRKVSSTTNLTHDSPGDLHHRLGGQGTLQRDLLPR